MAIRIKPSRNARTERAPREPWYLLQLTPAAEVDPEGLLDVVILTPPEESDTFLIGAMPRGASATQIADFVASRLEELEPELTPDALLIVPASLTEALQADAALAALKLTPAEAEPAILAFMQAQANALAQDALQGGLFGVNHRYREFAALATRLYKLAPWTVYGEQELFRFQGDGLSERYSLALVLGEEEEGAEGVVFYATLDDLWLQFGPRIEGRPQGCSALLMWGEDDPEMNASALLESWGFESNGLVPAFLLVEDDGSTPPPADDEDAEPGAGAVTDPDLLNHLLSCMEAFVLLLEKTLSADADALADEDDDAGPAKIILADGRTLQVGIEDLYEIEGADEHLQAPDLTDALAQLDDYFDEDMEYDLRLAAVSAKQIKPLSWHAIGLETPEDGEMEIPAVVFYLPRQDAKSRFDKLKAIHGFATLFDGVGGLHMLALTEGATFPHILDVLEVDDQDELDDLNEHFEAAASMGMIALVFAQPGPGQEAPLRERDIHLAWPVRVAAMVPRLPDADPAAASSDDDDEEEA